MANAIRRFSVQIMSNSHFPQLFTLALALALVIYAPIGGGGGGY